MTITREDPRFWDIRTLERKLRKGILTKKEIEKHLKTVGDVADKIAPAEVAEGEDASD